MKAAEYINKIFYDEESGEEIARIRIKFEILKGRPKWSTIQLEGFVISNWLPIIRYDFAPKEKSSVHVHKEYRSLSYKEEFICPPEMLIERAQNHLQTLSINQIKELIKKREEVFRKEGK